MNYVELNAILSHYITAIYNNEQEFIAKFFPELDGNGYELIEICFSSCRVKVKMGLLLGHTNITITKQANRVCEWVDDLVSKKLH